jgi:DNA topoisomerase-1
VRDAAQLARIKALAIPPAWTEVWIAPRPDAHIQAVGRDAKGRKQYRYHERWRAVRDETKYGRMVEFGAALPTLRLRVTEDLALPGLPRERVLATIVALLDLTHIRIGNPEYAAENETYGLTTLRSDHVLIAGSTIRLQFTGKGGKPHAIDVRDKRLARILRRCQELPGQELFQYLDEEGQPRSVGSGDVNEYLRAITGQDFTAKDFRTWAGTVLAAHALRAAGRAASEHQAKQQVVEAIKRAALHLGNTPTICRKCYVHPAIIDAYLDGSFFADGDPSPPSVVADTARDEDLACEEAAVLAFLRRLAPDIDHDHPPRKLRRAG